MILQRCNTYFCNVAMLTLYFNVDSFRTSSVNWKAVSGLNADLKNVQQISNWSNGKMLRLRKSLILLNNSALVTLKYFNQPWLAFAESIKDLWRPSNRPQDSHTMDLYRKTGLSGFWQRCEMNLPYTSLSIVENSRMVIQSIKEISGHAVLTSS